MSKKYKLAVLASHPIQYQTPLFKMISENSNIDLTVYFCWDFGVEKESYNPEFGIKLKWDIPLLTGYKYKFLNNYAHRPDASFFGLINPAIIKELKKNKFDAIWIHGYASITYWLAFIGAWASNTPIFFRGESHLINHRARWKQIMKKIVLKNLFNKIKCFLPIGTLNTDYFKYYGVPDNKMFPMPYCVNNDFFKSEFERVSPCKDEIKRQMGIDKKTPVILYASKMILRKRAIDILKAFERIHEKVKATLVFVGDGPERPGLETYTRKNNLEDVHFVGFKNQTELSEYYVIADVLVLPSDNEPWGLIINEAMNFALPVITTDQVGAAPDLIKHGRNGFVYPAGDVDKLSELLSELLTNQELLESMGRHSLDLISKWSYEEDIEGLLSALQYIKSQNENVG